MYIFRPNCTCKNKEFVMNMFIVSTYNCTVIIMFYPYKPVSLITVVGDGPHKKETGPGSFMHAEIAC